MAGKNILILGGGVGGLVAANELRKRLGSEHKITIIDKSAKHLFTPSLLWLLFGWRQADKIQKNLSLLQRKGIEYLQADIHEIDTANKLVQTSAKELSYDYLLVALGAEINPDGLSGFSQAAHQFYDLPSALKLKDALKDFNGGHTVILISSLPFKCPAAPYEAALLLDYHLRAKGIRNKSKLSLFTPEPLPMPVAGPILGNAVKKMLEEREVEYHPQSKLLSINPQKKELTFENNVSTKYDLLIGIPPHRSSSIIRESGLGDPTTGWITVNPKTLKTQHDNVFAVGDACAIKLPNGMMLPKAGVFAHYEAEVVAHNLASEINGDKTGREFEGKGYCWVELGYGKAGFASGNFYSEPSPSVKLYKPGRIWHWGKILFEKYWMRHWF